MRPLTAYTPFKDLNVGDFMFVRPHDLNLVPLDGKSGRWCYQGWRKWIFENGETSMVGSYEERIKFGWTTFVWRLLEWEVEM